MDGERLASILQQAIEGLLGVALLARVEIGASELHEQPVGGQLTVFALGHLLVRRDRLIELPAAPDEAPAVEESSEDQLGALQAERDELFDRLQRLAAEFDNYRKRSAREQAQQATRANERLVKELLPIVDDLGRALEAAADHEEMVSKGMPHQVAGAGIFNLELQGTDWPARFLESSR